MHLKASYLKCDAIFHGQNSYEITLVGFGTFKSAKREARTGRNPATGATIQIPASVQPKFVAGKQFKDALNTK